MQKMPMHTGLCTGVKVERPMDPTSLAEKAAIKSALPSGSGLDPLTGSGLLTALAPQPAALQAAFNHPYRMSSNSVWF